jgi:hypothetical protein
MNLELISIPTIATIVYWVINLLKYTFNNSEKFKRLIPITAAILGAVLSVICFYAIPKIVPADNVLIAIVIGGASGLTATGSHQLIKQLEKNPSK